MTTNPRELHLLQVSAAGTMLRHAMDAMPGAKPGDMRLYRHLTKQLECWERELNDANGYGDEFKDESEE